MWCTLQWAIYLVHGYELKVKGQFYLIMLMIKFVLRIVARTPLSFSGPRVFKFGTMIAYGV